MGLPDDGSPTKMRARIIQRRMSTLTPELFGAPDPPSETQGEAKQIEQTDPPDCPPPLPPPLEPPQDPFNEPSDPSKMSKEEARMTMCRYIYMFFPYLMKS